MAHAWHFPFHVLQLLEAMKGNSSVTSVDLSGNHISDEGAQAIAAVLSSASHAKELIELDLRDNPLTITGLTCLVSQAKDTHVYGCHHDRCCVQHAG